MEKSNEAIQQYLKQHEKKELLRFITCGSVDDGKSTLIGRLLYDTKMVFEDQLAQTERESKKYGTVENGIDLALLVDGLQSEKEQGITIDVAYRFFTTGKRKFIIADTPGHEQYTRNTVTGASTADLAIILIDARKGVLTQTRRHSFIVTLLGIRNIIVTVNKMDLVNYSEETFQHIVDDYKRMFDKLKFALPYKRFNANIKFIPISALKGDNITKKSDHMPWYKGKTLLEYLDTMEIIGPEMLETQPFRFPVQYVNRPNAEFRGYAGTISSGKVSVKDEIHVFPTNLKSKIKAIIPPGYKEKGDKNSNNVIENGKINNINSSGFLKSFETINSAFSPMAVTFLIEDQLDISRGDLIVKAGEKQPKINDSFEAMIVWMDNEPMKNTEYTLKIYTKETNAIISRILFKRDVNSWEKIETKTLSLNDIARVQIDLSEKVAYDFYEENRSTGAFILIDKITNNTVAAGMIVGDSTKRKKQRVYTEAEIALNKFIREHFPEWGCKDITNE